MTVCSDDHFGEGLVKIKSITWNNWQSIGMTKTGNQLARLRSKAVPLLIQKSGVSSPLFKSTATTNAGRPGAPARIGK